MRRWIGRAALFYFRARNGAESWLREYGYRLHSAMVRIGFLLFFVCNMAAPQAITPQDLDTLRKQWEHRQRSEFWHNVFELMMAAVLSWIVWLFREKWLVFLKLLWKYLRISFRMPIEMVNLIERTESMEARLMNGQDRIISSNGMLSARVGILEEQAGVASFVADQNGNWTSVTGEMADLVGDHPQAIIGYRWKVRIDETDRERVMTAWAKAIKHHEPFAVNLHFISTNGTRRKVRLVAYQQIGPKGELAGYVGQAFKMPETGEVPPIR